MVEPAPDMAWLADLAARIEAGQLVRRTVDLDGGAVAVADACRGELLAWDGRLSPLHGPRWRLLIIGAGQIGRYLAPMAQALDYAVSVCDPREEYAAEWDVPGAPLVPACPTTWCGDAARPHTAIVALTTTPSWTTWRSSKRLKSPAFYVGALGRGPTTRLRRARLLEYFDLSGARSAAPRPHRPAHRQPHAAGDRGVDPGRDDRGEERRR